MNQDRFQKQLEFILEIDKEKNIFRRTHLSGHGRCENDAEHAWHMAVMIYLLKEYANEEFDIAKAMMMALIHDVVEIDAGDTFAFDKEGLKSQKDREKKAAKRIFGLLPEDQNKELKELFEEFECGESPEARFARVMDNFQPLVLTEANDGEDWRECPISKSQVFKRHSRNKLGSELIGKHIESIIENNIDKGYILP